MLSGVVKTFMHTNGEIFPQNYILDKKNIALLVRSLSINIHSGQNKSRDGNPFSFLSLFGDLLAEGGEALQSGKILFKTFRYVIMCVCVTMSSIMTIMSGICS